jgi:predicted ATPase
MESGESGTFTFLFTDIEASTRRWQTDREAMSAALAAHDETIGSAVEQHGGRVFKHTGDGICAVFTSPRSALDAAAAAQRDLRLPVRMGIHTGEAEARDGDYFGPTLNRCARIMDAGHGGQVLVSETARMLVGEVGLRDLGEHRLKDLARPERIFQLGETEFPELRHRSGTTKLPTSLTPLMGRDDLVADIVRRLDEWRLVTLVGVGGVGKTRLAVAAAEQAAGQADLTVFVDLGSASDGADVLPGLAAALSVKIPSMDSVAMALTGRRVVLVVDNCEHVLDAAAEVITDVLAASNTVSVVATSREGLAVEGEHLIAVPGLAADAIDSPALRLFDERARAVDSGFRLDETNEPVVVEICRRLDGIPLAIELAAARIGVMTPEELLDRLGERFRVLTGGRRRSADRHRTLREAIDWSYELLSPDEKRAFDRLAVFASTFDVVGAASVLDGYDELDALELLGALVDKSLLMTSRVDGQSRYRYLETIRSYAEEKLDGLTDRDDVEAACNRYLAGRVRSLVDEILVSPEDVSPGLRAEIPNLRRSLDWALGNAAVDAGSHLITPLLDVAAAIDWHIDGWADELLGLPMPDDHPARASLLTLRAVDLWLAGDFGALRGAVREILEIAPRDGAGRLPWWIGLNGAMLMALGGDSGASQRLYEEALTATEGESPDIGLYISLRVFREFAVGSAESDAEWNARREEILAAIDEGSAHPSRMIRHCAALARSFRAQRHGDPETMLEAAREAAELGVEGAALWFAGIDLQSWAHFEKGELREAVAMADHDHDRAYRYGDRSAMVVPIIVYALVLLELGETEAAGVLRGWLPPRMTVILVDRYEEFDRQLTDALPADRLAELKAEGRHMTPIELKAVAHERISAHLGPVGPEP